MEYIQISRNDNLSDALSYLHAAEQKVRALNEPELTTTIRMVHLYYLTAFAYRYHASTLSRSKRARAVFQNIARVRELGAKVMEAAPDYADIRWVVAVTMMLSADVGVAGVNMFLGLKDEAIGYAVESLDLDSQNPMARVVLNNFDALAPWLIGAKPERGFAAILLEPRAEWAKPHLFEYYISRVYAYRKYRDTVRMKQAFQSAQALYPESWRLKNLSVFVR